MCGKPTPPAPVGGGWWTPVVQPSSGLEAKTRLWVNSEKPSLARSREAGLNINKSILGRDAIGRPWPTPGPRGLTVGGPRGVWWYWDEESVGAVLS